jgi:hypothetical protein
MPTEGKGSFNPVRKRSQLLNLCGNPAEALSEFSTQAQIIVSGATAKTPKPSPLFAALRPVEV